MMQLTCIVKFWWKPPIYALFCILEKCRDLRIFPGTNIRFPGTKNYSAPLLGRSKKGAEKMPMTNINCQQQTNSICKQQADITNTEYLYHGCGYYWKEYRMCVCRSNTQVQGWMKIQRLMRILNCSVLVFSCPSLIDPTKCVELEKANKIN